MRSFSRWLAAAAAVATLSLYLCLQLPSRTAGKSSFGLKRPPREIEDVLGAVMGSPGLGPLLPLGDASRIVPKAQSILPGATNATTPPGLKQDTVHGAGDRSPLSKAKAVGIVPDLVANLPNVTLRVTYRGKVKVDMGNELEAAAVADAPRVQLRGMPTDFHTLGLFDADSPSAANPRHRAWLHWLVVNIPGHQLAAGTVLAAYEGPMPAAGTGSHRLVFAQFQQRYRFTKGNFTFIPIRAAFHIPAFMDDNGIQLVRAFNFYRINTDSEVAL
ncbi:uncharacterized protein LOC144158079 [Haemaphysalis longicornis]